MPHLDQHSIDLIESTIIQAIRTKLEGYKPETDYKPFHTRLLGESRMRLFSFIQSLNTTFGTAIYEPVAAAVAQTRFKHVETQAKLPNSINLAAQTEIDAIVNDLLVENATPNRDAEQRRILLAARASHESTQTKMPEVDLWLEDHDGSIVMIEIKAVKPNRGSSTQHKRDLLRWFVAAHQNYPERTITTAIAFPYNPYHPKPYRRWTIRGLFDPEYEILIAQDFWNFLAGADIHDALLDCFERAGIALSREIDDHFARLEPHTP